MKILLNTDLGTGESAETAAALLECVDLVNIAGDGGAGEETVRRLLRAGRERRVQTGALVGWPEQAEAPRGARELVRLMEEQVGGLRRLMAEEGGMLGHVKLRGALRDWCDERAELAEACVDWMYAEAEGVALIVSAGGLLHAVTEARGVPLLREISADRGYADEARFVPRGEAGEVIGNVAVVAERLKAWKETGFLTVAGGKKWMVEAETVGLQGDWPGSVVVARAVREVLGTAEG
jgi:UPF0271 protein